MIRLPKIKLKSCFVVFSFNPHWTKCLFLFILLHCYSYIMRTKWAMLSMYLVTVIFVKNNCHSWCGSLPGVLEGRFLNELDFSWNLLLFQDLQTGSFRTYLPKHTLFYAKEVFLLFVLKDRKKEGKRGKSIQPFWSFTKDRCSFTVHWSEKSK